MWHWGPEAGVSRGHGTSSRPPHGAQEGLAGRSSGNTLGGEGRGGEGRGGEGRGGEGRG